MNKCNIKVFDKNLSSRDNREVLHNCIVNSKGKVKGIIPDDSELKDLDVYKLDNEEDVVYSMLKHNVSQAKDLLDSQIRKMLRYENILVGKIEEDVGKNIIKYDKKCCFSPIGKCLYVCENGRNDRCMFCGEDVREDG